MTARRSMRRTTQAAVAVLFACALSVSDSAPRTFAQNLEEAESVRSSNPARFQQLLAELTAEVETASALERQRYRHLHAYGLTISGKVDAAIAELRALYSEANDPVVKFRAGALLANNYAITRQFSEALAILEDTLLMLEQVHDPEIRNQGLLVAGVLYNQAGQYQLGRYYSELVLWDTPAGRNACIADQVRLEALVGLKESPEDSEFQRVIRECNVAAEAIGSNMVRALLARRMIDRGATSDAAKLLESSQEEVESTHYAWLIGETQALLAETSYLQGALDVAEQHAIAAIKASAGAFTRAAVNAHRVQYLIASKRDDSKSALSHYISYAQADKAYLSEVQARELAYQLARHQALQKAHTIEVLNKQNDVLRLQQQVAEVAARNNRLLAALLTVVVIFVGYWALRTKRMQMSFRRLAETDALTNLANRRHFLQRAEESMQFAAHAHLPVALVLFDLDHFKVINDTYGHPMGDWVLKQVADACRRACRKNDLIGRLGGEEFGLLLLGCDSTSAVMAAEQCRIAIAAIDSSSTGHAFQVSASFGVAMSDERHYGLKTMMVQADQALYLSKHDGRNRVSLHEPQALPANAGAAAAMAVEAAH